MLIDLISFLCQFLMEFIGPFFFLSVRNQFLFTITLLILRVETRWNKDRESYDNSQHLLTLECKQLVLICAADWLPASLYLWGAYQNEFKDLFDVRLIGQTLSKYYQIRYIHVQTSVSADFNLFILVYSCCINMIS